ncbi:hypothetical protein GBA52_029030 [Prunus armeniaca]|nr:hypothetical protein GBA52_029030 [Prunus armeniaca]
MLRRKIFMLTSSLFPIAIAQLLNVIVILGISGGHAIAWRFNQVGQPHIVPHRDLGWPEDRWKK